MESSVLEEFRQNPTVAEQAAGNAAVYLAENGRAAFVLLHYEDYEAILRIARLPDLRHDQGMVASAEKIEIEL